MNMLIPASFVRQLHKKGGNMIRVKIINQDNLVDFVYRFADKYIGKDRNGRETTLVEEMTAVGSMIDRAELILCRDYYSRDYQRLARNFSEEDLKGEAIRSIKNAAKKLLFLNTVASKEGLGFVKEKIDHENVAQMYDLVKAYVYAINSWNVFTEVA